MTNITEHTLDLAPMAIHNVTARTQKITVLSKHKPTLKSQILKEIITNYYCSDNMTQQYNICKLL
jgi:hypothetical protein